MAVSQRGSWRYSVLANRLAAHPGNSCGRLYLHALRGAQGQFGSSAVIAHQAHVATGAQCGFDAAGGVADHMGAGHRQVVAEDHAVELQFAAQDVLQPAPGETGGLRIDLWIDDVGRHDSGQLLTELGERHEVVGADLVEAALVIRDRHMGVSFSPAVTGEMLAGGGHAGAVHAADKGSREQRRALWITFE
jgi:hypothetical protein